MECKDFLPLSTAEFVESHAVMSYQEVALMRCGQATFGQTDADLVNLYRIQCFKCLLDGQCDTALDTYLSTYVCSMVSCFLLCFIGFFMLINKKLRKHPYTWFAITCLSDAMAFQFF